jgi:hypothetical protein
MTESREPTGELTPDRLISWPPDGPVNRYQSPESVAAHLMSATDGPVSPRLWARYDRDSHSWKTARQLSPSTAARTGRDAYSIWPRSGSMRDGSVYELPRPALPIEGIGYGASPGEWPTPTIFGNHNRKGASANCGDGLSTAAKEAPSEWPTPTAQTYGTNQGGSAGRTGPMRQSLEGAAKELPASDWPTPAARDWRDGRASAETHARNARPLNEAVEQETAKEWPTPRAMDGEKGGPNQAGSKGDLTLPSSVQPWPTPRASDSDRGETKRTPTHGLDLNTATQTGRMLNPRWVEALQGWPLGLLLLGPESMGSGLRDEEPSSMSGSHRELPERLHDEPRS